MMMSMTMAVVMIMIVIMTVSMSATAASVTITTLRFEIAFARHPAEFQCLGDVLVDGLVDPLEFFLGIQKTAGNRIIQ